MMDCVTHLPRTSREHDAMWVIVDRLTKSTHFLVVRMTFTLDEFYRLYIREIVRLHGMPISIVSNRDLRFTASHGDMINDEHRFSSPNRRSVGEDHLDVRGHATGMYLGSQG